MKGRWKLLAAVCALVIGVYAYVVQPGVSELGSSNAADAYYNLLVRGFRAGQLSVKQDVPPGLAGLADPYDLSKYVRTSGLLDLSYYKGRLYLYFGVTPALIFFWPFTALTGHYLFHRQAVVVFCGVGFLASVGLLCALWRRYFADVRIGVVAACVLALGLASGMPVLLSQSDVWEVPISCGYMLTMLALGALWCAMHEPERKCWWLAVASAVYGLALGARPSLLFGAVILLVPVAQARREGRPVGAPLVAAVVPMMLIGLGLMLYNAMRFGNPFEFGLHYQLHAERRIAQQFFGLQYLWFNLRVYFLEPVRWTVRSPFVRGIVMPPAPPHLGYVELPYGVLTNIPFVWLALAAPLAWRNRSEREGWVLRWFVIAVGWLFGIAALTLGCYYCTGGRFEVEFLPALLLLAVVGILGLERALAPSSESGLADRSVPRCAARCGWGLLLGFSVAFNLLAGVGYHAEVEAGLGSQLLREGKVSEAFGRYQQALRINPDCAEAHAGLGTALAQLGRIPEAIAQYEQALQIKPDYAEVHLNFGSTLATQGKAHEAITHYEEALRIKPDYPDAHESLGNVLMQLGRLPEAIGHYEQALRINPDLAEAHNNLATALGHSGQIEEAIQHYQRALQINPDFAEAHDNLGIVLAHTGKIEEAIAHFNQALRINPDYAQAHYNLGKALAQAGRVPEAIEQYEKALRIQPDFTPAQNALAQLQDRQ